MTEVSNERFEDFQTEVRNSFADVKSSNAANNADLKETLGSRMSELTGEIKAYNQMAQSQGQKLVGLEKDVEDSKKHIDQLQSKAETNALKLNTVETTMENNQKNTNRILTIITVVFAAITLLLKFLNIG